MKKLFFFRSSSSNNGNNSEVPQSGKDNQAFWENPSEIGTNNEVGTKYEHGLRSPNGLFSKSRRQIHDNQNTCSTPSSGLRKSRSLSSAGFLVDGLEQKNGSLSSDLSMNSLSSANGSSRHRARRSTHRRALTPERHSKSQRDSSCSSTVSSKIVDRYIDGEQHQQEKSSSSRRNQNTNGNAAGRLPPRVDYIAPTSPIDDVNYKPKSQSFRETKGSPRLHFSTRDWVENGFGQESPRRLAKNVVERLSQTHVYPKSSSSEFDNDFPITIDDIYGRSGSRFSPNLDEPHETISACNGDDFESQKQRLEKEKNELQMTLERELDRRSADWSLKLEKFQTEEHRLRERVRELAEQNVSLQKEVYSFNERENENRSRIAYTEQQLRDLTSTVEDYRRQNKDLSQNLSDLQENYQAAEGDLSCVKRSFDEKEKECKELQKSITRLLRTCNEQEKTIDEMREGFSVSIGRTQAKEEIDKLVRKLQMEQIRLTGVELGLRREVESFRIEADSLRLENISLLNRLKSSGKEIDALTFKLDDEMWSRVCCLQNEGISMLKESSKVCSKLLDFIKGKGSSFLATSKHDKEGVTNGLDGQFIVETEMKILGFKRGTESLMRSLQTISFLLLEKSSLAAAQSQSQNISQHGLEKLNKQISEENIRFELKAEVLLTSVLREKMYSKEIEVEQLQAELATAVRGNDILRCEVQNAFDDLSCATHKLKDLELQMMKKEENKNRLEDDLQESSKELAMMRGILPKVSGERDLMWDEVKQYNEKNMLLNSEVIALKKKLEELEEDILIKEGQITILKDSLGSSRSFDLLSSPDSKTCFLLR